MQLGSMFITNCSNALHVSDAFCLHPQEHPYWIIHPVSCHTPEAVTTVFKCS